jgi:hypothetical protein
MDDKQLDSLLQQMANAGEPQIPSAGQIWFRAQVLRKARQRERIERPLIVMRGIAVAVCLAVMLAFGGFDSLRASVGGWFVLPLAGLTLVAALTLAAIFYWPSLRPKPHRR